MSADDVGAGEDRCCVGSDGGVDAVAVIGWEFGVEGGQGRDLGEGVGQKAFAGGSCQERQVEPAELVEVREEWVVLFEFFAETEAGVEDDPVARDAGGSGSFESFGELREDEGHDFFGSEGWQGWPILRAASGVHENGSAVEFGTGGRHFGVPEVAADVVDDFCSGFDGVTGGDGVEGVDGENGVGTLLQDCGYDGEDAGLLFVGGERGCVGAGGFAADVEDVGAFVEHGEALDDGAFGGVLGRVEVAAVGEGVGGDVEDAHDESSPAE